MAQYLPSRAAVFFLAAVLQFYSGPASAGNSRVPKTERFAPTSDETKNEWQTAAEQLEEIDSHQTRMINSDVTLENEYPYMVALLKFNNETQGKYDYQCGGSLISPSHILTAAHCVEENNKVYPTKWIKVALGVHFINDTSSDAQLTKTIVRIKIHEDYNGADVMANDIAILTLKSPVKFTETISPICLPPPESNDQYEGELAIVKGWGATGEGEGVSEILHHAVKKIISNSQCQKLYGDTKIFNHNVCTYRRGKHFCNGDSGSPLVIETDNLDNTNEANDNQKCQWIQVGIASWGFCGAQQSIGHVPDVYTRVTSFLPWIKKEMKRLSSKPSKPNSIRMNAIGRRV